MRYLSVIHIPKTKTLRAVMLVVLALGAGALFAEGKVFWQEGGVVVCDGTWHGEQAAVSDDSGGVFVVWYDSRGENGSIWAQHIDRDGNAVWQENGVFVGDGDPYGINQLSVISDGHGGLVTFWQANAYQSSQYRHQVTAQRLDATGAVLWDSAGVVVTGADSGFTYKIATASDGRGGAIVAWTAVAGKPSGVDSLVVQRIDSLGNLCWDNPGLVLATDSLLQTWQTPYICSDNAGGACVTCNCSKSYLQTIVQQVDSAGCPTWPGAGVLPFTSHLSPIDIMHMPGGYVVVGVSTAGISVQRIDEQGQLLWGPDGSTVYRTTPGWVLMFARVVPGPGSSSFVIWTEERNDTTDVYAQLVSGMGERYWDSLGIDVGSTNEDQDWYFGCVAGGADGFIVSWPRNSGGPTRFDIYAQYVDTARRLLWGDPGLGIAIDTVSQWRTPCVMPDARQGAIITWGCAPGMLKAQRAGDVSGVAGPGETSVARSSIRARPSPARGAVEVCLPRGTESVVIADALGRVIRILPVSRGDLLTAWDLKDASGSRVPAGVYVFRQRESGAALGRAVVVNP